MRNATITLTIATTTLGSRNEWFNTKPPIRVVPERSNCIVAIWCLAAIGFPGRVASAEKDTQMEGLERMLA
ncbi:hypothetical protein Enr13x_41210 [Stieleria neptunia]|uniref:Uncharacterized protein n=1 Tax=Stieleria neptunia TaxID=2527979 RepID=A0A518HTY2_9BACT|nr:hypothetical protein Enr13x_41210 [Stieleria neptunia]